MSADVPLSGNASPPTDAWSRLREVGADALLKCEMVAGHGGKTGRYDAWRETAFEIAFMVDQLGAAQVRV